MESKKENSFINVITDSFSAYKFVEPHTRYIDNKTGNKGYVACNFDSFDDAKSFQITHNPINIKIEREIKLFSDFLALLKLIIFFFKRNFSIIHTHNAKAGIIARLAAKISGANNIIHTTYDYGFINLEKNKFKRFLFILLERLCGRFTDKLIVVSDTTKEDALRYKIIDEERIVIIPEVPSIEEFNNDHIQHERKRNIADKYSIEKKKDEFLIGTVARLVPHKGVDTLIKSASILAKKGLPVRFLIIGGGPEEQSLKELAENQPELFLNVLKFVENGEIIPLFWVKLCKDVPWNVLLKSKFPHDFQTDEDIVTKYRWLNDKPPQEDIIQRHFTNPQETDPRVLQLRSKALKCFYYWTKGWSKVLQGHTNSVMSVCRLNETTIVSGSLDRTLRVWDLTNDTSRVLRGHTDWIRTMMKLNETTIVSGSYDRTLRVWYGVR